MNAARFDKFGGVLCVAATSVSFAFSEVNDPELGVADTNGFLQHGCKNRLQIARRATDDLKHLRRGSLLLQRLRKVGCASVRSVVR